MNNEHEKNAARIYFQTKLRKLEIDLSRQKMQITASLLKLKEKDILNYDCCSCVGFCHIKHWKHNFYKCRVEDIFDKLKNGKKDKTIVENKRTKVKENKLESWAKKMSYKCTSFKLILNKMEALIKHKKQHEQDPDKEQRPNQTPSFQCKARNKRSKTKRSIKPLKRNGLVIYPINCQHYHCMAFPDIVIFIIVVFIPNKVNL